MAAPERLMLSAEACPSLPAHVKMHHDKARDRWVLLAPERLLEPDDTALEILRLCDGQTSVAQIAEQLAQSYDAPVSQIQPDILAMLQDLSDKGFLRA